jgi:hypothetical protein
VLSRDDAIAQARAMLELRNKRKARLDRIRSYVRDQQRPSWLAAGVPTELHTLARLSRVNLLKLVVDSVTQAMYVDGYRTAAAADDEEAWALWQRNRMDARQIGVHRAALTYGESFLTVLPGEDGDGEDVPVMRGASPRQLTASWGDDDEWPAWALERRRKGWRLFDDEAVYEFEGGVVDLAGGSSELTFLGAESHDVGVVPVVRYRATFDLDDEDEGECWGEVTETLMNLQDQINVTTFGLLVAQHYGAFRQRYILGWLAETEEAKLKASASKLWTFEDHPSDVTVGEFSQTDLKGYIESREATIRHLATVSQTPAHELLGQLVNLSAEALAAAEAAQRRKITERQTVMGESHEQALELAGQLAGVETDPSAWVRWKDTEARALASVVDALGKLVQMLGVPPQELWELVPNVSQQQVERWKAAAAAGDAFALLNDTLDRQAGALEPAPPAPTPVPEPVA